MIFHIHWKRSLLANYSLKNTTESKLTSFWFCDNFIHVTKWPLYLSFYGKTHLWFHFCEANLQGGEKRDLRTSAFYADAMPFWQITCTGTEITESTEPANLDQRDFEAIQHCTHVRTHALHAWMIRPTLPLVSLVNGAWFGIKVITAHRSTQNG